MRHRNQSGFTLVETSVTAILLVTLATGIVGLQYILGNIQVKTFQSFTNVEAASGAINRIEREIRTARQGDNGAFLLESGTNNSLTFYSDVDANGSTDKVTYSLSGTTLTRSVIRPTGYPVTYPPGSAQVTTVTDIMRNGATPLFTYYNGNWPGDTTNNPLATPVNLSNVKMIRIYIRLNNKANDSRNDYILDTSATIRMVKTNL